MSFPPSAGPCLSVCPHALKLLYGGLCWLVVTNPEILTYGTLTYFFPIQHQIVFDGSSGQPSPHEGDVRILGPLTCEMTISMQGSRVPMAGEREGKGEHAELGKEDLKNSIQIFFQENKAALEINILKSKIFKI